MGCSDVVLIMVICDARSIQVLFAPYFKLLIGIMGVGEKGDWVFEKEIREGYREDKTRTTCI